MIIGSEGREIKLLIGYLKDQKFVLLIAVVLYGGPEGSHMQIKNVAAN